MPNRALNASPQVFLKIAAERLAASIDPTRSTTVTGTTKKVAADQAMPNNAAITAPAFEDRDSIALKIIPTVAATMAQPRISEALQTIC